MSVRFLLRPTDPPRPSSATFFRPDGSEFCRTEPVEPCECLLLCSRCGGELLLFPAAWPPMDATAAAFRKQHAACAPPWRQRRLVR